MVFSGSFTVNTRGYCDILDVTRQVVSDIAESGIVAGVATVFVGGSTAGVTTIEYESGAVSDLKAAIERAAPSNIPYNHDARWGDGNGFSHVRAALLGPSLSVPLANANLALGTWQQIVVVDFDNKSRRRNVSVTVVGE